MSSVIVSRDRARALRQQGFTFTEIQAHIGVVPKSTLSGWLKGVTLSTEQRARIDERIRQGGATGRPLARAAWKRKIAAWQQAIDKRVEPLGRLSYNSPEIARLVCGLLYLCEGGKYPSSRQLMFGNSDPRIIATFLRLLRQSYRIDESRLRARVMHRWDQHGRQLVSRWSTITGIPKRQFYPPYADRRTEHRVTKRSDYLGVCCIQYGDTAIQYELQAIGEAAVSGKEMVEQTGIEPVASSMPLTRSPS